MNDVFSDSTSHPDEGVVATPLCDRPVRRGGEVVRALTAMPAPRPDLPPEVVRIHVMRELLAFVHARAFASGRASVSAPRQDAPRPLYVHTVRATRPLESAAASPAPLSGWSAVPTDPSARPPLRPPAGRADGPEPRRWMLAGLVFVLFTMSFTVAMDLTGERWTAAVSPGQQAGSGSAVELPVVGAPVVPAPARVAPASPPSVAEQAPHQAPRARPPAPPSLEPSGLWSGRSSSASQEIPSEVEEAAQLAEQWQRGMSRSPFGQ